MTRSARSIPDFQPMSKAQLKRLKALTTKKGREEAGLFLVEGWKSAVEALSSDWEIVTLLVDPSRVDDQGVSVLRTCDTRRISVHSGSAADIRALSDVVNDQGIISVVRMRTASLRDLPATGDLLVLDAVSDPGNLGTLVRTADWFGLSAVIVGPGSASPYNEKVVRATMGSLFRLPVIPVGDLTEACRTLKNSGIVLAGAIVQGGTWSSWLTHARTALILGSEAHGISPDLIGLVNQRITIPRVGSAESLNVAGAGAVLMSSLADQRLRMHHAPH